MPHRPVVAVLAFVSAFVGALLPTHGALAQGRERRTASPFALTVNRVFAWNNQGAVAAPPDCKPWRDAFDAFKALRTAGQELTVITGTRPVLTFISYAYYDANRISTNAYANLEALVIVPTEGNRYRVYAGSKSQHVFCGFDAPQELDRPWLDAGLKQQEITEPVPAPVPSSDPLVDLSSAYFLKDYGLVRDSLVQRGFISAPSQGSVAERCAPSFEPICERYPEAVCRNRDVLDNCTFVWLYKTQLIAVLAFPAQVSRYFVDLEVQGLKRLDKLP